MNEELTFGSSDNHTSQPGEIPQAGKQVPNQKVNQFVNQPMWRTMIIFLIPLVLSNALQSVGQLVGSTVVGRWIGVNALAAISGFFPLFFLFVSFTIGIGAGSSILIGQAYGAQNEERLKAIIGTTLTFTFLMGVVLALLGGIFTWDVLRLIGTPANVIAVSVHYARILFWAMPALFLYFVYTTFMRGTGDSKTPFYVLMNSTVLNLAFLPLFIFGWLGLPKLGVYGAVNQLASYVQMSAISIGITVSIFAAQSIGANQLGRLKDVIRADVALNYIIGGILIVLVYLFSEDILSWFLTSKPTLHIAHSLLMITLWSYLIFGNAQVIGATMRARVWKKKQITRLVH